MLPDYETKSQPLLTKSEFLQRMLGNLAIAIGVIGLSLLGGMIGYHHFEGLNWIDSYAEASMILSGMGPLSQLKTTGGKIFAGSYALYSGLLIIITTGFLLSPIVHRIMHSFHLEDDEDEVEEAKQGKGK